MGWWRGYRSTRDSREQALLEMRRDRGERISFELACQFSLSGDVCIRPGLLVGIITGSGKGTGA